MVFVAGLALGFRHERAFLYNNGRRRNRRPVRGEGLKAIRRDINAGTLPVVATLTLMTLLIALPMISCAATCEACSASLVSISLPYYLTTLFVKMLLRGFCCLRGIILLIAGTGLPFTYTGSQRVCVFEWCV